MPLEEYRAKRDFTLTPEPDSGTPADGASLSFVVQKHHARALHYDFRLELDGVLVSWAVPKGPSLDPHDKRLAVHVEDHPLDYGGFEGTIPAGEYGAGSVIVWDRGTWQPLGDPHAGLAKGDFKFTLQGEKLRGLWVLVRLKPRPGEKRESWLLIKEKDEFARPREEYDLLAEEPGSVLVGDGGGSGGVRGDVFSARSGGRPTATTPASIASNASAPPASAGASGDPNPAGSSRPQISPNPSVPSPTSAPVSVPSSSLAPAATPSPFPATVDLELATLVDLAPDGDEWIAEVKYDGYRVALALDDGRGHAFTRSHADWSERFSGLTRAVAELPASSAVIDGEAIVFDSDGVSRFELLQRALGSHPEKIAFAAFDLHYLNGYDLRDLPLTQRKELLRALLAEQPATSPLIYADHVAGGAPEFYRRACLADLEGIVCKRASSRYVPGRGREWLKIKCRQSQELVVGGFTEGAGSRSALGSVLVGTYDGDRLIYAGRVGSGLDEATVASLRARLDALERPDSPFDPAPHITGHVVHWTRPEMVIQAAFREWTSEGILRQPVFLGIREDKAAREVVRESAVGSSGAADASSVGERGVVRGDARRRKHSGTAVAPGREPIPTGDPALPDTPPTSVLGIRITNPDKLLFPDSPDFPKLDLARYYAAIAPLMLPEVSGRPLTLVRCPVGHGRGCFYQRHPDAGLPAHVHRFKHALKDEPVELLYIDSAEGLVALAQMGVGEVHTWMSRIDAPTRPDRICFDLDPGPAVTWAAICSAAKLVREECEQLGFSAFVKSTGSKGLHVVLPIEPVWEFDRVRAFSKGVVDRLVARHPGMLVGKMAKDARGGRIFFDYLRNAEGASAVAPYSTRMKPGPSCAVPLEWAELTDDLDIRAFTPGRVLARADSGTDPWSGLSDAAAGAKVLRAAESALEA